MEIHNSSLAFYPPSASRLTSGQTQNARSADDKKADSARQDERHIPKQTNTVGSGIVSSTQNRNVNRTIISVSENLISDPRAVKALNAYAATFNQPSDELDNQSLAGIDYYV